MLTSPYDFFKEKERQMRYSHLFHAQALWDRLLQPEDRVIDATCGNGKDTLFLAERVANGEASKLYAFDIQENSIINTHALLKKNLSSEQMRSIHLLQHSHATFPPEIAAGTIKLIVYNLGYLPGGDKALTTRVETTLKSLEAAMALLTPHGVMSIMCYPGHEEGAKEEKALLEFVKPLPPIWIYSFTQWCSSPSRPSLLILQRQN